MYSVQEEGKHQIKINKDLEWRYQYLPQNNICLPSSDSAPLASLGVMTAAKKMYFAFAVF